MMFAPQVISSSELQVILLCHGMLVFYVKGLIIILISYLTIGAPSSPLNIDSIVDEYYANYSTVTVTWDHPTDHSTRVDYYHYQYQLADELMITHNTTNTSFTHFGVYYNENVTISVFSFNCIGKSIPVVYKFNIGKYSQILMLITLQLHL